MQLTGPIRDADRPDADDTHGSAVFRVAHCAIKPASDEGTS